MIVGLLFLIYFIKVIFVFAEDKTNKYRDGPIGLPGHILLRNSKERMRRHKHKIVNEHTPEIEEFNKQVLKDLEQSESNLNQMNQMMINNQDYNILNMDQMYQNYDFTFVPEWFNTLPPEMTTAKEFVLDSLSSLAHMGLVALLSTNAFQNTYCSVFSNEMEKAICLKNSVENINKIAQSGKQIVSLNFRVLSGGRTGKEALVSLNTLASNPENVGLIKTLGSTIVMYITLMREISGDENKALAGSVMTKLTDLPVASNVPDTASGGFGRVNVILPRPTRIHRPDYDIAKLKAGASEKDLLTST